MLEYWRRGDCQANDPGSYSSRGRGIKKNSLGRLNFNKVGVALLLMILTQKATRRSFHMEKRGF